MTARRVVTAVLLLALLVMSAVPMQVCAEQRSVAGHHCLDAPGHRQGSHAEPGCCCLGACSDVAAIPILGGEPIPVNRPAIRRPTEASLRAGTGPMPDPRPPRPFL